MKKKINKKNNKDLLIYIVLIILFELYVYIMQPFIVGYETLFIIITMILVTIFYLVKYKGSYKNNILKLLFTYAILLKTLYILKIDIHTMQHDVDTEIYGEPGHLDYILTILNTNKLPNSNAFQFYHPPLWHFLAALWLKINNLIGVALDRSIEGLQFITTIFSSITILFAYKIVDKINIKDLYKLFIKIFLAFHPMFIILSGSINNDCLEMMLQFISIYLLIKWSDDTNYKNIIILSLVIGLAIMTKINGMILYIPILYAFIKKFINTNKKDELIKQLILLILISSSIGFWYQIRNIYLFGSNNIHSIPLNSRLSLASISWFLRFITISFDSLFKLFVDIPNDYNILSYIIKNSLYGEGIFARNLYTIIFVIINSILVLYSILCSIKYLINKNKQLTTNIIYITWLTNVLSYIVFNIKFPFTWSMDFRYIVFTLLAGITFIFINIDNINNKFIKNITIITATIFIILSFLYPFLLFN